MADNNSRVTAVWRVDTASLAQALKDVVAGLKVGDDEKEVLEASQLLAGNKLTLKGQQLYKLFWVHNDRPSALKTLSEAVRPALVFQVIEQELRGYNTVPEEGVLELLRLHSCVPDGGTIEKLRPLLKWVNELSLLTYSKRYKTVRVDAVEGALSLIGADPRAAAVISPRTPMSNVVRLRQIIRSLDGVVWWVDPQLSRRTLEDLVVEINFDAVTEIRLLSGDGEGVLSAKAKADFERFRDEVNMKGAKATWHADPERDWHDRFLLDDKIVYNMPPGNTLYKGDYSEILPTEERPPVDEWWARASDAWNY